MKTNIGLVIFGLPIIGLAIAIVYRHRRMPDVNEADMSDSTRSR
jgi:hypothetical protein